MLQRTVDPLSRPFDDEFDIILRQFSSRQAVKVDFRNIVGNSSASERFTHRLHPYPAKLLLNIPLFFLNCSRFVKPGNVVYDPFCGSGTVLVEALVRGAVARGADSNPLARLITRAKTTLLSEDNLEAALDRIFANIPRKSPHIPTGSVDLTQWFAPDVSSKLARLLEGIRNAELGSSESFFQACFSAVLSKVSLADPTVPVPVRIDPRRPSLSRRQASIRRLWLKERASANVFELFEDVVKENFARLMRLREHAPDAEHVSIAEDARTATTDAQVDLVISSPPYGSAQKYIRSSSLSLQWLGLTPNGLRDLERNSIGREHFNKTELKDVESVAKSAQAMLQYVGRVNPLRRHIAATYLAEMQHALIRTYGLVRKGGHIILIVGNNTVCGKLFNTQLYLSEICENIGLQLLVRLEDRIRSRGLITKRHATAGLIAKETILVFSKD